MLIQDRNYDLGLPGEFDVYDNEWGDPEFIGPSENFVACPAKGALPVDDMGF